MFLARLSRAKKYLIIKKINMIFNSITFIFLFLPAVVALYYIVYNINFKHKHILLNVILILFSFVFFAWTSANCFLNLMMIILWNYLIGIVSIKWKKIIYMGIIGNIMIFIYLRIIPSLFNFINDFFSTHLSLQNILIPLGLSFILFHCISYLLDIYHGKVKANKNILEVILYITFFPKLVQGPIVKYYEMEKFLKVREVNFEKLLEGTERFIIGLGKKVLIADVLAITVNDIFSVTYGFMDIGTAWLGSILFTIQIYMDFSGYSDMAIGLGKIFGFHFAENFNFPYSSTSVSEFWRQWHISLGSWFREYLYFPLGGSRTGNVYFNLLIVFLVTGIWHGSTSVFILWGMVHGLCVIIEKFLIQKGWFDKIPKFIRWFYTMFIVNIGWIVFKVTNFDMFKTYIKHLIGFENNLSQASFSFQYYLSNRIIVLVAISILGMIFLQNKKLQNQYMKYNQCSVILNILKYIILLALFVTVVSGIITSSYSPFIYFQF